MTDALRRAVAAISNVTLNEEDSLRFIAIVQATFGNEVWREAVKALIDCRDVTPEQMIGVVKILTGQYVEAKAQKGETRLHLAAG